MHPTPYPQGLQALANLVEPHALSAPDDSGRQLSGKRLVLVRVVDDEDGASRTGPA